MITRIGLVMHHYEPGETSEIGMKLVLLVAAAFAAIMRFGSYSL